MSTRSSPATIPPSHATLVAAAAPEKTEDERATLADQVLRSPHSTWRSETLRVLYASALAREERVLADALEPELDPLVGLEERLARRGRDKPIEALKDDGLPMLTASGQHRVLHVCAQHLSGPSDVDELARALREALDWLSPASAFVQALRLLQIYGHAPHVSDEHVVALASVSTPSAPARGDLLRAIGAVLSARGSTVAAAEFGGQAAALSLDAHEGSRP